MDDDVLNEIRAAREAFAAAHGYDVRLMAAALQRMDEAGDRPLVRFPPRRPAADAIARARKLLASVPSEEPRPESADMT